MDKKLFSRFCFFFWKEKSAWNTFLLFGHKQQVSFYLFFQELETLLPTSVLSQNLLKIIIYSTVLTKLEVQFTEFNHSTAAMHNVH